MLPAARSPLHIERFTPYSLQRRIMIAILLAALLPLILVGGLSYASIYYLLQNKVEKGVQNALEQKVNNLESMLTNLDQASKQLIFEGSIGSDLREYLSLEDTIKKSNMYQNINRYLTLISYTNPRLGMMEYFLTNTQEMLSPYNYYSTKKIDVSTLPYLSGGNDYTFYGPHPSLYINSKWQVFSIVRQVGQLGQELPIAVYIETNFKAFPEIFDLDTFSMPVTHQLKDRDGKLVYAEENHSKNPYVFSAQSEMGWTLSILIEPDEYNREMRSWLMVTLFASLACLLAALLISWGVWRMIYGPLRKLKGEIQKVANSQFHEPVNLPGIKEFDDVLMKFDHMKLRVVELLDEIEQKERNKRQLEVEKLMYQINPHFIHNTLNTVQWVAMMNHQDEIVKLIATFTRLLNYNLGKEGRIVHLYEEVDVLRDYITLQQIRYNYKFHVEIGMEEETLRWRIPRFILQPLVENSLYHGFKNDDGKITVTGQITGGKLLIEVADNGSGMTPEEIDRLFDDHQQKRKAGLGIGLRFINNVIRMHYGDGHGLTVISEPGKGTAMSLLLPPLHDDPDRLMPGDETV
ncbi:MAG: hypothetical protein K0R57_374 [Paenibacillaceae bacterium]|jgi:two-component system sensor histidine kinase YesM|nr:hypothetical protein [Paenibacillaceae bacterium]